MKKQFTAAFTR